jgi:diguanylate cyclase (GGDEF)-like protein/PAS domain S-box-containing protein
MNITQRFIAALVLIGVLPLLAAGFVGYTTARDSLLQEAQTRQRQVLANQEEQLALIQEQIESLVANIAGVEQITEALLQPSDQISTYQQLATQVQVGYILNGYLNVKGLVSIHIFGEAGTHFQVGDTLDVSEEPNVREQILNQLEQQSESWVYWPGVLRNINARSTQRYVLPAVKPIYTFDQEKLERRRIGIVIVNYSIDALSQRFNDAYQQEGGYKLFLLDQLGRYIVHPDPQKTGEPAEPILRHRGPADNGVFLGLFDGQEAYITQDLVERTQWSLTSVIPKGMIQEEANLIRDINLYVFALALLIVTVMAAYFSRNVVSPIRHVTQAFKRLKAGETGIGKLAVTGSDEVSQLAQWFNLFLDEMHRRQASDEALRISEERYELVSRATNEGIWDLNRETGTAYFSERFKEITGHGEDLDTSNLFAIYDITHPADRRKLRHAYREFLVSEHNYINLEHRILRLDGSTVYINNSCQVVHDEQGRLTRMVGSIQDITLQKEIEERLRHDAAHDPLTGLYNRAWMTKRINRELVSCAGRPEHQFAVVFIDLDDFKKLNDTLGHSHGDLLLVEMAKRIESCLRPGDPLARLGGDEFVVLLPEIKSSDALVVVQRLVDSIAEPFMLSHHEYRSQASIGVAFSHTGYRGVEEILRDADTAMYRAKSQGKGRYEIFDDEMHKLLLENATLEMDLQEALNSNQFEMHYQPVLNLATNQIDGFEALLRWNHPSRLIMPGEFIPLAEESRLIHQIGDWVLQAVLSQVSAWQQAFELPEQFKVALNISPQQFSDTSLVDRVSQSIGDLGVDPTHLAIELTETAIFRDRLAVLDYLTRLSDMQISIYLDDFGTGYSSLSYLNSYPIDAIKIDRSFVVALSPDSREAQLVNTLILMARELGVKVIAEGVEAEMLLDYLLSRGCDYIQGFVVHRPMPALAATRLLSGQYPVRRTKQPHSIGRD